MSNSHAYHIKKTRPIEYYLKGVSKDDLYPVLFRNTKGTWGDGAIIARAIAHEVQCGHIVNIYNVSEFHRSLTIVYGSMIPRVQQISKALKERNRS